MWNLRELSYYVGSEKISPTGALLWSLVEEGKE